MEKCIYPGQNSDKRSISTLLPRHSEDEIDEGIDILKKSSVVDGTEISGSGLIQGHGYRWKMAIESGVKSIAVVPDRFFDIKGRSYQIDQNRKVSVTSLPTYENYKDAVIYKVNSNSAINKPKAKIIFDNYMEQGYSRDDNKLFIEKYYELQGNKEIIVQKVDRTLYLYPFDGSDDVYADLTTVSYGKAIDDGYAGYSSPNTETSNGTTVHVYRDENEGWLKEEIVNGGNNISIGTSMTVYYFPVDSDTTEYAIHEPLSTDELQRKYITIPVYQAVAYAPSDNKIFKALYNRDELTLEEILNTNEAGPNNYLVNSKTYGQNRTTTSLFNYGNPSSGKIVDELGSIETAISEYIEPCEAEYLAIIVDSNDDYYALLGRAKKNPFYNDDYDESIAPITWYKSRIPINVNQFKGIDMWLRFDSINAMIYFLITKYEQDIVKIIPSTIDAQGDIKTWGDGDGTWAVNKQVTKVDENSDAESKTKEGKLWAYINPRTMQPYEDDYWFHQGEAFYVKSLTMAPKGKRLKGNRITVRADQWPGMYMMIGETYIRSRDTGEDERMQIKFPLCKVKSDHTLTLSADGDPTTFNLDLEVARPANGIMMELTAYEIAEKMLEGDNGCFYAIDGSTEVLSE